MFRGRKMSLPDYKMTGKQASSAISHSPVVQLNVGGHLFSSTLSTLRKHPDSKLAELFSIQPKVSTDAQGRFFIDRDGSHFGAVLEFLRFTRMRFTTTSNLWSNVWRRRLSCLESWWGGSSSSPGSPTTKRTLRKKYEVGVQQWERPMKNSLFWLGRTLSLPTQ
ncbi:hypothetical protein ILYODFUR_012733 [Ilyodon furcidens]|uniref:Potassium channel tetramerisation-type BTB domain-containing protein n=1 Tax=Ilyodon furcidens TaxID=33524 RepID=A0ABV0USM8_9TELE